MSAYSVCLLHALNKNEVDRIDISFSCCTTNRIYYIGIYINNNHMK